MLNINCVWLHTEYKYEINGFCMIKMICMQWHITHIIATLMDIEVYNYELVIVHF